MDMDNKSTPKNSGDRKVKREVDNVKTKTPTVLTWIPGIRPVIAPHITPNIQAKSKSKIISPLHIYNTC